ncbi:hypothetical protein A2U01_0044097, partial [Trifolium medium]|nr:hypothetical protein [Trifolium medium]
MQIGRECMEYCGLTDLGFIGHPFTWTNGREGDENIQCRLDRAMATEGFINRYTPINVNHLGRFRPDHAAVAVCLEANPADDRRKIVYVFRFEEVWSKNDRCENLIQQNWARTGGNFEDKLESMKCLDLEFKELRTNLVKKEIITIEARLKDVSFWDEDPNSIQAHKELEKEHSDL